MTFSSANTKIYIGALIMIILQLFLGPIMSINVVVPNMLLAYTVACIVSRPEKPHIVFAFIMGLLFDFICNGPVGAMAFVMLIFSYIIAKVLMKFENINLGISLLAISISVLFIELFYGAFQVSLSVNVSIFDVFAYRILPCTIYDIILAFVIFAIMIRVLAPSATESANNINSNLSNSRW